MIFSLLSSVSCQTRCHDQLWSDSSKFIGISAWNHAKEPGDTSLGLLKSDWMQAGKKLGIPGKKSPVKKLNVERISNRDLEGKNKNYFTSSDPHHDMLGGGCQVKVVIENMMGRMETLRTLISGFLGLVILVRWALVTMFLS